jgi:hypothetical protein
MRAPAAVGSPATEAEAAEQRRQRVAPVSGAEVAAEPRAQEVLMPWARGMAPASARAVRLTEHSPRAQDEGSGPAMAGAAQQPWREAVGSVSAPPSGLSGEPMPAKAWPCGPDGV